MDRPTIQEQIDACRPGRNDPDDAALRDELAPLAEQLARDAAARERFERTQQLDAAIVAAVHDVPVPAGLAERVLAALPEPAAAAAPAEDVPVPPAALELLDELGDDEPPPAAAAPVGWWRRRSVLAAAAAVAASLAIACGIFYWLQPAKITLAEVQQEIEKQYVADVVHARGWQAGGAGQFPFPKTIGADSQRRRWRKATVWGYDADIHDLVGPNPRGRATLFVIRRSVTGLADSPFKARLITGAKLGDRFGCLAAWQSQDPQFVYVLAVEGDVQDFKAFLRSGGPLARRGANTRFATL